ncbi:MAG: nucleotide exchange factor GrpE [Candidatus Moranbacteria bacterium]|nr:nucleotide exchange factor GrpE [Candidatus Moranbacteria bacterium]
MTKKKEKEEDVIKEQDIEKAAKEEIELAEGEVEAEKIDKKVHEELIKTAENYISGWKRCQADFENYKKDQARRMEEFREFATLDFVFQIFPVLDSFESSLTHVPEDQKESAWVGGILHIKKQLEELLRNNKVEEIEARAGDEFNPEVHEAVKQESGIANQESGNKISKVLQKGYKMEKRVIRPARVIVE